MCEKESFPMEGVDKIVIRIDDRRYRIASFNKQLSTPSSTAKPFFLGGMRWILGVNLRPDT